MLHVYVSSLLYIFSHFNAPRELTLVFEQNIIQNKGRVVATFGTISQMCKLLNVHESYDSTRDNIQNLCQAVKEKHSGLENEERVVLWFSCDFIMQSQSYIWCK